jgi:hypothetical protein
MAVSLSRFNELKGMEGKGNSLSLRLLKTAGSPDPPPKATTLLLASFIIRSV